MRRKEKRATMTRAGMTRAAVTSAGTWTGLGRAAAALALLATTLAAIGCSTSSGGIAVREVGSFHVGGREVTLSGLPVKEIVFSPGSPPVKQNPNGQFESGQMYVRYTRLVAPKARYPMLMWHGGGLTGVTWETRPDGRPGWESYFLNAGWDTYISDAVERGRASWSQFPEVYTTEPVFRTKQQAWELFRYGKTWSPDPAKRVAMPGTQFPLEFADQFAKQSVPRWASNDALTQQAYDAYVEKSCPCVIVVHSQGGFFAMNAALRHPDKVKAIVTVEPSGAPDPSKTDLTPLSKIPMLWVWGDYVDDLPFWKGIRRTQDAFRDALSRAGGRADVLDLPAQGIHGNSHMLMMDRNADQVAALIQQWLTERGLMR